MFYWFAFFIMSTINLIYFRTKYIGRENFPPKGEAFIIACNHISNLDPFVMGICDRRRFNFIAKEELFSTKFRNKVFRGMGAFPIKRDESDFRAIRETLKRVKAGGPIIIFPEGTRGTPSRQKKIQPGVGLIAVKGNVPVIPAYIQDTEKALPEDSKWFKFHPVTIRFGKPLHFDKSQSYESVSHQIMDAIYSLKP